MLGFLGIVLKLLGVVILVQRVNEPNKPCSVLVVNVDSSADDGVCATHLSNLFEIGLELPNKETVVDQVVPGQKVNVFQQHIVQRWHVVFQRLNKGDLLHVLSEIVIFQRNSDVTALIHGLTLFEPSARFGGTLKVKPDTHIKVLEEVVHHDDVRSGCLAV